MCSLFVINYLCTVFHIYFKLYNILDGNNTTESYKLKALRVYLTQKYAVFSLAINLTVFQFDFKCVLFGSRDVVSYCVFPFC